MKVTKSSFFALLLPFSLAGWAADVKTEYAEREVETIAINDTSKVVDLDEVVVVAQPKEQVRLRLQPLSSNVFGSDQMKSQAFAAASA